ncbi:hypothetical protein HDE_13208 [Halotydeus destructor]|nr:hypothetical protein HDE_13208 [Halotydeus destructor]
MSRPAEHCAKIKTEAESMSSPFGNLANGTGNYGLNCDNFYLTNEQSASRRTMSTIASSHDNMDVKFREKGNVMSYDQVDFSLLDSFGEPAADHQFTFEASPSASGDPQGGHDGSGSADVCD